MKKTLLALIPLFLLFFGVVGTAQADGIIIPEPPICLPPGCVPPPLPMQQLVIKYHRVDVTIKDQLVTTHVDQVIYNPNDFTIEGTYVFPLPADAVVSHFVLWIDGSPVEGKVLDAGQARQVYEDIVRNMRDPALLEYVGRGAVQASIYPISPGGERRIELEYQQVLTAENGLSHYVYPLNTEKFSAKPLESVSVTVDIQSSQPIQAVYSPSHAVDTQRVDDRHVIASYEAKDVLPNSDFSLFYSVGETEAFHLLSYLDPADLSDADGFFMLLLAPKVGGTTEVVAKDVLLVLDRSGSMDGEKFRQAQQALNFILERLHPEDRFFILTFSSGTDAYSRELAPASSAGSAEAWVNQLSAAGSTDIDRALHETAQIVDPERPTYLIFMTDGLPTRGVTDSSQILADVAREMPKNVRLFPFGVGYDVDTYLLDSLAQNQHGLSTYVEPGNPLDTALSAFYEKISTPVLTDLQIDYGGLQTYDIYPNPLPDLFESSQVVVTGRYKTGGSFDLKMSGKVNGALQTLNFADQRFADGEEASDSTLTNLPLLWATRKIGYLMNQIRLNGPNQETIDQIVKLSLRYGIATPYTSFLVTENMPLGAAAQNEAAQNAYSQLLAIPTAAPFGQDAVRKAAQGGAMSQAEQPAAPAASDQGVIKSAGGKTFVNQSGTWIDTTYDPATMKPQQVEFLSEAYFNLANTDPNLGAAMALGEKVIVVFQGQAIEVIPSGEKVTNPVKIPTDVTSTPLSDPAKGTITPGKLATQVPGAPVTQSILPWWVWAGGGAALLVFVVLLIRTLRK